MNRADHRLYVLLDPVAAPRALLPQLAQQAVQGGATLLQYRDKEADGKMMVETAQAILKALGDTHPPLLINDRVDVAMISGAQGVHLGQSDITPEQARALLGPHALIGRTLKNHDHAERLRHEPVDYATCGGVFGTVHKDNPDQPIGLKGLKALRDRLRQTLPHLPVGAIAGIDAQNVADVMAQGVDGIAVIGAVLKAQDPVEAAKALRAAVDDARTHRH